MSIMGGNLEHPRLHYFLCPYRVRLLVEFADELGLSQIVLVRKGLNHSRPFYFAGLVSSSLPRIKKLLRRSGPEEIICWNE